MYEKKYLHINGVFINLSIEEIHKIRFLNMF